MSEQSSQDAAFLRQLANRTGLKIEVQKRLHDIADWVEAANDPKPTEINETDEL